MSRRIDTAAYLHIGYGILILLIGILISVLIVGGGALSGDATAFLVTSGVGIVLGIVFIVLSVPSLAAGYGLLKRKEWGRVLAFVMSIIALFSFPIGTAVGGYTIWVLVQPEAREEFE